jgi:hypothetical protein
MSRTEHTMLRAAMDFCRADADVQRRTILLRELRALHDGEVCYISIKDDFGNIIRNARPQAKWCEHCKRLPPEDVDYADAKRERRAAKTRMKRAYKKLARA